MSELAASSASSSWEQNELGVHSLQIGSRVEVICYGPFRGLRGVIRMIDPISADLDEALYFYLVALDGSSFQEPLWFEYHEVAGLDPVAVAHHGRG